MPYGQRVLHDVDDITAGSGFYGHLVPSIMDRSEAEGGED